MFIHHVFFWLKVDLTQLEKDKFKTGLVSLTQIENIKSSHIGVPASTNRHVIDTSYSYSLLLIFENAQEEEIYQAHPIHLNFVAECASLWDKVAVFDSIDDTI
ncbi:MAG: Dabb family protein [Pyrinomonadaceae bacterium]|nr:Dabb family protein [Sphingobacteriaceae bacterium]